MLEKITKNLIPLAIVIAGILIAGALVFVKTGGVKEISQASLVTQSLTSQQAAERAISYIDQIIASQGATTTASLIAVNEEESVYKLSFKIGQNEYTAYVSKDGKYLFPEGYDLTATSTEESNNEPKKATCEDLKKTDKPILEAFVVSKCPYGLQMQRVLYEVVKSIPSLAENIKVKYIGAIENNKITSMHGDEEAQENLRQICVREEQTDKYWSYIGCHIKKGDVDSCLAVANVDKSKLNTCMTDTTKGLEYAKADFTSQDGYKVSGSPTLFLNGEKVSEFDFGGRTAEAVKTLLCCGFGQKPDTCSQKLSEDSAATGFSESYGSSGDSTSGGCGQ
jgi:hypothetical protein